MRFTASGWAHHFGHQRTFAPERGSGAEETASGACTGCQIWRSHSRSHMSAFGKARATCSPEPVSFAGSVRAPSVAHGSCGGCDIMHPFLRASSRHRSCCVWPSMRIPRQIIRFSAPEWIIDGERYFTAQGGVSVAGARQQMRDFSTLAGMVVETITPWLT